MSDLFHRLRSLFRRSRVEAEMHDELSFHLERETERYQRAGRARELAERQARIALGGLEQAKEEYRDARGVALVENLTQDLRYGLRFLRNSPGFAAVAVLSLALGIGANAAIFSLADALLLRPLPVPDPNAVVVVSTDPPDMTEGLGGISYSDYRDFSDKTRSFESLAAFQLSAFSVAKSVNDTPQLRAGMLVSDNFFRVLDVQPPLGRGLLSDEGEVAGRNPVIVLAHDFWRNEFSADQSALGTTIRINGIDFDIVGVASKEFTGLDPYFRPNFYVPALMWQRLSAATDNPLEDRSNHAFRVTGRLRPGATPGKAQAELATIWKGLEPQHSEADRHRVARVRTELQARVQDDPSDAYLITLLMALVAVVLIIACANVANLLFGRAGARTREVAIRMALGVSRTRLVRQFLTESLLLAVLGAIAGLAFAYGGIRFLQTISAPATAEGLQVIISPQLDTRVLQFSLLAAIASVFIFVLIPALETSKADVVSALKNAAGQSTRQRMLGRNALVIGQVALSMVLLIATGMLISGVRKALLIDPGFRTERTLTMVFDTTFVRYTPKETHNFYRQLVDRARMLPGVSAVALGENIPFSAGQSAQKVIPEGYEFPKGQLDADILTSAVDENYFAVMQMPIVRGRAFTANDKEDAPPVAIINEQFAKTYWANQDPIGKRLRIGSKKDQLPQVVGITPTIKYSFIGEQVQPYLYVPFAQNQRPRMALFTLAFADPAPLAMPLRQVVHALEANQPIFNVLTLHDFYRQREVDIPRVIVEIVGTMGAVGLSLALIGLYGWWLILSHAGRAKSLYAWPSALGRLMCSEW
jgi:predicted permease